MRYVKMHIPVILLLFGLFACGDNSDPSQTTETVYSLNEYAPLAVGSVWTYDSIVNSGTPTIVVTAITGTEILGGVTTYITTDSDGDKSWHSQNFSGTFLHKSLYADGSSITFLPYVEAFPAGMKLGEQEVINDASYEYYDGAKTYTGTASDSYTLAAVENVTVPAGTFADCLKFSGTTTYNLYDPPVFWYKIDYSQWFAKGVGLVKANRTTTSYTNAMSTSAIELASYDIAN